MKTLYRHDLRTSIDRATGAHVATFVGRGLRWFDSLYGFAHGVFFAVLPGEIPPPETLEKLAFEAGVTLAAHPAYEAFKTLVAESLVAGAIVDAPEHLAQMAEPDVDWARGERQEAERRHLISITKVSECIRQLETDFKLRIAMRAPVERIAVTAITPVAPLGFYEEPERVPEVSAAPPPVSASSAAAERAREAITRARENELPQRLPDGARRAIQKLEPGVYAISDGAYVRKANLSAAMADAGEDRDRETVVVDWDGEWPVVARRYAKNGRVVYRVEDALRRAGLDDEAAA